MTEMDTKEALVALRERTGLNRRAFCEYFDIPYRTEQDWELGNRNIAEYLLKLMEYKVTAEMEKGNFPGCRKEEEDD